MAKFVSRKGKDVAQGVVISGRPTVLVNDRPIATIGDIIAPHTGRGKHLASVITGYEPTVLAEDRQVSRKGDATSCGHPLSTGSDNVFAGPD